VTIPTFDDLPAKFFRLIYADPCWEHKAYSGKGLMKSPQMHYACIPTKIMMTWPVRKLADPEGCIIAMWARDDMLDQALDLMRAWGFVYKTKLDWVKMRGDKLAFGLGRHFRNCGESLLIGRSGKRTPFRRGPGTRSMRSVLLAQIREHSRKPDEMRAQLEARYRGPMLEMFARERAPNWFAWGNEIDKFTKETTTCLPIAKHGYPSTPAASSKPATPPRSRASRSTTAPSSKSSTTSSPGRVSTAMSIASPTASPPRSKSTSSAAPSSPAGRSRTSSPLRTSSKAPFSSPRSPRPSSKPTRPRSTA
jgi:N6-adenosine-specific RNA methylase IME4